MAKCFAFGLLLPLALIVANSPSLSGQMTIVNAASFEPGGPIAPGSFAAVKGENLCGRTAIGGLDSTGLYPAMLGPCSLTIAGTPAILQYVAPGQMNFIVPQNAGVGAASVMVNNGTQLQNGSMTIGAAGPGVFSLNAMGMGNGAMLQATLWRLSPFSASTNGQPTPIAIYMTGLDLTKAPVVNIGGVPVNMTFYGDVPGYPGLQQINITLPANMAGVGRAPVTVTSGGQTSNVTFMSILSTTAIMQGMPGWTSGMAVAENMPRGKEMSSLAFNPANNTALVADEAGDALRVISLDSQTTTATITLPTGAQAGSVAVNSTGTLGAVGLRAQGSVALVDLTQNRVTGVIGTGYYAGRLAFAGTNPLVTNGASRTVAVIDTNAQQVTRTVTVGFGASGIAVAGNTAVVANMEDGSISIINLNDYSVASVSLPAGSRPHEVAISTAANKAVITNPMSNMSNNAFVLRMDTLEVSQIDLTASGAIGPGGVAVNGILAYIAGQMSANVTAVDLASGSIVKTFSVDPDPRSLDVNPANNQLLVLCQGTGTLDVVDSGSGGMLTRMNAASGDTTGAWTLPVVSSITPTAAAAGASFTLLVNGTNLQTVTRIEFLLGSGMGMGSGMMGGGSG